MGCATSKEVLCEHCNRPVSVRSLSYSTPFSRRSRYKGDTKSEKAHSQRLSDSQNVASLISATNVNIKRYLEDSEGKIDVNNSKEGKAHSKPKHEKVSKRKSRKQDTTPSPKAEPEPEPRAETINTWELMDGLEGNTPPRPPDHNKDSSDFTFPTASNLQTAENDTQPKPMWLQGAANQPVPNSVSIISDFDPEIISVFQKALEELSPERVGLLRSPEKDRMASPGYRTFSVNSMDMTSSPTKFYSNDTIESEDLQNELAASRSLPGGQNKVVIYFTSLRGIRKTYEDCCHVRMLFKGLGVKVDERDVSMHYGFREELRQVLGTEGLLGNLPKVFVKGMYIGGADELQRMHDDGELVKVLADCEMTSGSEACDVCGDTRFVPCEMCSGSCKIYIEVNGEGDGEGEGEFDANEGGFQRCPYCNENGLVRCINCCSE